MDYSSRNASIHRARANGDTFSQVARSFGISRERVRQICLSVDRLRQRREIRGDLSTRACNVIAANLPVDRYLFTREDVRPHTDALIAGANRGMKNLGKATMREIQAWLDAL